MDQNTAQILKEVLEDAGYEAEIREDYSGRSMYGKTTAGVVTDAEPLHLCHALFEKADLVDTRRDEHGSWDDHIPPFQIDNMGLDFIIY